MKGETNNMEESRLVKDTIEKKKTVGIPITWMNVMQHGYLDRIAGVPEGSYKKNPEAVYIQAQKNMNVCVLDQYIPRNPLDMGNRGYERRLNTATAGAERIVLDGMEIDSPDAVVEHLERFVFPHLRQKIADFDAPGTMRAIMEQETAIQRAVGDSILKTGYGFVTFPILNYYDYGYENYFMAYALYPEIIEEHFRLQADLSLLNNSAAAKLYQQKLLPPLFRLDHDIADSRGTLVDIRSLDKIWMPHFTRCIEPLLKAGVKIIWHCDGNLMQMIPRLLSAGISGFQGFQYEDGMDYEKICRMKTRDGDGLIIWAGVSVTRALPLGTPQDIKKELRFLVDNGPATGLFLGASSSITPGVPWKNMQALIEGLAYYHKNGRQKSKA